MESFISGVRPEPTNWSAKQAQAGLSKLGVHA